MSICDTLKSIISEHLMEGECISLPIPVKEMDGIADVYFLHTVDYDSFYPRKPYACLYVCLESGLVSRLAENPFGFDQIELLPGTYRFPEGFHEYLKQAEEIYAQVREAVSAGVEDSCKARYVELVRHVTQPCLLPFYNAVSPSLFVLDK